MIKKSFYFLLILIGNTLFAQNNIVKDSIAKDSIADIPLKKIDISLDIVNRYMWRGQSWGGNHVVVQPTIKYNFNEKLHIGLWATHNFKKDYFYDDGSFYKGYQELDVFINYDINKFFSLQLWDYYWPTVEKVEGIDNSFFNYKNNGVKTLDFIMLFDFTDVWLPINATISTLVAGNDFRYDENGENPKQNYTTYLELGYTKENIFKSKKKILNDITFNFNTGFVLNNQAAYYTAGNYNKSNFVNITTKLTKEFKLSKSLTMPLWISYIHNPSKYNTDVFGKNFLLYGVNFSY